MIVYNSDYVKKMVNELKNNNNNSGVAITQCQELIKQGEDILANNQSELFPKFIQRAEFFLGFVIDAPMIKVKMSEHKRPQFEYLWRVHHLNKTIAKNLAPEENRCAIRLSLTLGLAPSCCDESLGDISTSLSTTIFGQLKKWGKEIWEGKDLEQYIPVLKEVKDSSGLSKRLYIKSLQLANRLREEWGAPLRAKGKEDIKNLLLEKHGIVFFMGGFGVDGNSNHIDLWNGKTWASYDPQGVGTDFELASERAKCVWFWEITEENDVIDLPGVPGGPQLM